MTETITRINGNGQPYTVGLPTIKIIGYINDVALDHIFDNTGLRFEKGIGNIYEAQPTESKQIVALFLTYNFKTKYYNNWQATNTIYLKCDHHVGFDIDSVCYECAAENRIPLNGLEPGDRLAC